MTSAASSAPRLQPHWIACVLVLLIVLLQSCALSTDATQASPPSSSSNGVVVNHTSTAVVIDAEQPLTRFLFGSCNQQDRFQPMWPIMQEREPQMFLWLGDVIYADKATLEFIRRPSALTAMKSMYRSQYTHAGYAAFRESTRILGIYDDHDYGENDGHADYPDKEPARHLFLDFIDESPTSARRYRDGIYADYIFGPPGQRVKLILLDARYNQDPTADEMLGAAQWAWLEAAIESDDDVQLYILGTGVQFVSTDKRIGEGWRLKPKSRAKVFDLFARRKRNPEAGVIFLSGDVHFAEADVTYVCTQEESEAAVRVTPFYDFTSSGLTHSVSTQITAPIAARVLPIILDERESYAESLDASQSIRGFYAGLNFGQIDIDWQSRQVQVQMVDTDGQARLKYRLPFASLSASSFRNDLSVPAFLSKRCEEERVRAISPPMFVIPGVKFAIGVILLAQLGFALVVTGLWHFFAKRAEWKAKTRAAREQFKLQLKEKQEEKKKKKGN